MIFGALALPWDCRVPTIHHWMMCKASVNERSPYRPKKKAGDIDNQRWSIAVSSKECEDSRQQPTICCIPTCLATCVYNPVHAWTLEGPKPLYVDLCRRALGRVGLYDSGTRVLRHIGVKVKGFKCWLAFPFFDASASR